MNKCFFGDCRTTMRELAAQGVKVQTCVTSPPYYGLRDYGHEGQLGLESTPDEYVANMVEVFRCVRDLLADDGTLWLNLGDSYAGSGKTFNGIKAKDLIGIPWMVAFALRADGWYLRQDIIWSKPNPMPESVTDRCTKAHEYIFMLSKSERYYFDSEAISEPANLTGKGNANSFRGGAYINNSTFDNSAGGNRTVSGNTGKSGNKERKPATARGCPADGVAGSIPWEGCTRNKRSVWTVATKPYSGAHFATFPPDLIEPCILAGAPVGGIVLDPFFGSGTTGQVSQALGRQWIGFELNTDYESLQQVRTAQAAFAI